MAKEKLILVGGGGHCKSCIDVIELQGNYLIEGVLDSAIPYGEQINGYSVLGNDGMIKELAEKNYHFLVTVGQIKSAVIRAAIFEKLSQCRARLATIVSPKAYVSPNAKIGTGTIVFHGAVINSGAIIGQNSIINSLSLIEHDASVGSHTHISTGALINGNCSIGDHTFIGSGAVITNNIAVGNNVVIGAGSVIIKDLREPAVYAGNPAKKIGR